MSGMESATDNDRLKCKLQSFFLSESNKFENCVAMIRMIFKNSRRDWPLISTSTLFCTLSLTAANQTIFTPSLEIKHLLPKTLFRKMPSVVFYQQDFTQKGLLDLILTHIVSRVLRGLDCVILHKSSTIADCATSNSEIEEEMYLWSAIHCTSYLYLFHFLHNVECDACDFQPIYTQSTRIHQYEYYRHSFGPKQWTEIWWFVGNAGVKIAWTTESGTI